MTRRRVLALIVVVATVALVAGFRRAGSLLLVEDALQPARAIVVFGGGPPFRAMKGAALYKEGWAKEVWLTQGIRNTAETTFERLGIEMTPEYVYNRAVLERLGVPSAAIRCRSAIAIPLRRCNRSLDT